MVIVVEIVDLGTKKPFLGGWRNAVTDIEYHNAATQTLPRRGKLPWDSLSTRDTQTKLESEKGMNFPLDKSSQTFENGVPIPSISDAFLTPGKFESARLIGAKNAFDEGLNRLRYLEEFAVKIQKFYRAYRMRSMIRHFASVYRNLVKTNERFYRALDQRHGNARPLQIIRSTSPKTRDDFEMLYNLVDRWRIGEIERANRSFAMSSRFPAHAVILKKEIELLRAIDCAKTRVKRAVSERKNLDFLARRARPVTWIGYRGFTVSMETLRVQRAKEEQRFYEELSMPCLSRTGERLRVILKLREFIAGHKCEPAYEIAYIIDQELCLMGKNLRDKMLDGLRDRLKLAFIYLIRNERRCLTAKCRSEDDPSSRYHPSCRNLPTGYAEVGNSRSTTRLCLGCERLLPIERFSLNRNARASICLACESRVPKSSVRPVNRPYEEMLRRVRKQEAKYRAFDSVAFLIGPKGVRHLVDVIWHGKSGVSESGDIDQLALVRFQADKPWAPWNSLVLTKREAVVHASLNDPAIVYSKNLLQTFFRMNLQARLTFKSLDIFSTTFERPNEAIITT